LLQSVNAQTLIPQIWMGKNSIPGQWLLDQIPNVWKEEFYHQSFRFIAFFSLSFNCKKRVKINNFRILILPKLYFIKITLAACYFRFCLFSLLLGPEDGDSKFLWNYNEFLPVTRRHVPEGKTLYRNCVFFSAISVTWMQKTKILFA
jgi:hypothetical protein